MWSRNSVSTGGKSALLAALFFSFFKDNIWVSILALFMPFGIAYCSGWKKYTSCSFNDAPRVFVITQSTQFIFYTKIHDIYPLLYRIVVTPFQTLFCTFYYDFTCILEERPRLPGWHGLAQAHSRRCSLSLGKKVLCLNCIFFCIL